MPKPPAADVAAVSEAPDTQPMPVCTIGRRQPTSSQNRVERAGCIGSGGVGAPESDGVSDMGSAYGRPVAAANVPPT